MPANKNWFEVKSVADGVAEVHIYDEIGLWGVSASDFVKAFKAASRGASRVDVHINSPGGDVSDGIAIYNTLVGSKKEITTYADGWAVSIASLILQAGSKRYVADNSLTMVHNPWGFAVGDAASMRKSADVLDKHRDAMILTYVAKTGKTADEVIALLDAETWMTGAEAVEMGFADAVYTPEAVAAQACARFAPSAYQTKYRNLRPEFLAAVSVDGAPSEDEPKEETAPMPEPKKEEPKVPETNTVDPDTLKAQWKSEQKARAERIRKAAFPGQETLVQDLVDGDGTIEEAVLALNDDFKKRGADVLADFKAQSDSVEHTNDGDDSAPKPTEAAVEDLEQTMVKVYRSRGCSAEESARMARAFVSR